MEQLPDREEDEEEARSVIRNNADNTRIEKSVNKTTDPRECSCHDTEVKF